MAISGEELFLSMNSEINTVNENCCYEKEKTKNLIPAVGVPCGDECAANRLERLTKILIGFEEHLTEKATHCLGCPVNQNCSHYEDLSPFLKFNMNNIGDPFKESSYGLHSKNFEARVLDWFAQQWEIGEDEYWGYVTNGGTEGNLHSILLGRELLPNGVLYASKESHYSIFKIARMYRMDCEVIGSLPNGEIDCTQLRAKLLINKDRPAIINVTIGTTFKGATDNLDLIIQTLKDCDFSNEQFYIHLDAAIFGFITPFLEEVKYNFKKPIGSVSISGHKFLGSPMPCGVTITRKKYINTLSKSIEYIDTLDTTISGSRNGLTPIFMWYDLNIKCYKGLQQDVEKCLKNAQYLRDRLNSARISTMLNKMSIIVVFERPLDREFILKWQIQCERKLAHIVVMPHVTIKMLDHFLHDFIQARRIWYQDGEVCPPCVAEDIGVVNCSCSIHGKEEFTSTI